MRNSTAITFDFAIASGKPTVNGVPTAILASRHRAGDSIHMLALDYPHLTRKEISAAIMYENRAGYCCGDHFEANGREYWRCCRGVTVRLYLGLGRLCSVCAEPVKLAKRRTRARHIGKVRAVRQAYLNGIGWVTLPGRVKA